MASIYKQRMDEAKKNKNDEFYTLYSDIEKEMVNHNFTDKTVYCCCDDPKWSNFFAYFLINFDKLKLKKLIATHYVEDKGLFEEQRDCATGIIVTKLKNKINTPEEAFQYGQENEFKLEGDGDFRSDECKRYMNESDIIVTNPPFSLFRQFLAQLKELKKSFIFIGTKMAMVYVDTFKMYMNNEVWYGYTDLTDFRKPDGSIQKFGNCSWFTNYGEKPPAKKQIILTEKYYGNEEKYQKYDNYDAINVDRLKDIPIDYEGVMGVPITFLDGYEFFEENYETLGQIHSSKIDEFNLGKQIINGKEKYPRIAMKKNKINFEVITVAAGHNHSLFTPEISKRVNYVKDPKDKGGVSLLNGELKFCRVMIQIKKTLN